MLQTKAQLLFTLGINLWTFECLPVMLVMRFKLQAVDRKPYRLQYSEIISVDPVINTYSTAHLTCLFCLGYGIYFVLHLPARVGRLFSCPFLWLGDYWRWQRRLWDSDFTPTGEREILGLGRRCVLYRLLYVYPSSPLVERREHVQHVDDSEWFPLQTTSYMKYSYSSPWLAEVYAESRMQQSVMKEVVYVRSTVGSTEYEYPLLVYVLCQGWHKYSRDTGATKQNRD